MFTGYQDIPCSKCGTVDQSQFKWHSKYNRASICNNCKPPKNKKAKPNWYTYGLTEETYNALLERQNGTCAICGKKAKLNIDHDHVTGQVRGLLCHGCNALLGKYERYDNDIEKMQKRITYHEEQAKNLRKAIPYLRVIK
jgi:Recombination endonuclease VII